MRTSIGENNFIWFFLLCNARQVYRLSHAVNINNTVCVHINTLNVNDFFKKLTVIITLIPSVCLLNCFPNTIKFKSNI